MWVRIIKNAPPREEVPFCDDITDISKYIGQEFEVIFEHKDDVLVMLERGKFLTVFKGEYEEISQTDTIENKSMSEIIED